DRVRSGGCTRPSTSYPLEESSYDRYSPPPERKLAWLRYLAPSCYRVGGLRGLRRMVGYRRDEALPSCHRPDRLLTDHSRLPPRGDGALLVSPSMFSSEGQSLAGTLPENSWASYVTA